MIGDACAAINGIRAVSDFFVQTKSGSLLFKLFGFYIKSVKKVL